MKACLVGQAPEREKVESEIIKGGRMVYIELKLKVPRHKVMEIFRIYQEKVLPWDQGALEKLGGKFIGCWYTEYGDLGEITQLHAYPDLETREKLLKELHANEKFLKESAEYRDLTPFGTIKVLRPAPFSALQ